MKFNSSLITHPIAASVITACMLCGLSLSAQAEDKAAEPSANVPAGEDFKKLDVNQDGKVSLKEAVKDKTLAGVFDAVDANHDGVISTDEHTAYKISLSTNTSAK